jgi:hypothetical protein
MTAAVTRYPAQKGFLCSKAAADKKDTTTVTHTLHPYTEVHAKGYGHQ